MSGQVISIPAKGSRFWKDSVQSVSDLPASGSVVGEARVVIDDNTPYIWNGASWNPVSGGGASDSFNTIQTPAGTAPVASSPTDVLTLTSSDNSLTITGDSTTDTVDFVVASSVTSRSPNTIAGFDGSGNLESVPNWGVSTTSFGPSYNLTENPNNGGGDSIDNLNVQFVPLQNSPNENWNIRNTNISLDSTSTGFNQGTAGNAINMNALNITHNGTGDVGGIVFTNSNIGLGNGTDPISVNGLSYYTATGQISDNVTMANQVQGHGFQTSAASGAILQNQWIGFYDFANVACAIPGYQSFVGNPNIAEILTNHNYNGLTLAGNMPLFSGNAGYFGVTVSPTIGTIPASGTFQGLNVNPTITDNRNNATGLYINMSNVTNYAGVKASLVVQDITYEYNTAGTFGNTITVEYTNTTTAGNEVASLAGTNITVSIESGVSTATQVKAALDANITISGAMTTTITGTASNPQVTYAQTNLAGGINSGSKKGADITGDVSINGALSFTGALSIGQLTSFAPFTVTSSLGVASVDQLITSPSVAANATITGTDLLAINTAMLLTIGNNASVTSSFLGYAALGLPAVLSMGTGSTIDLVEGAAFAISLDGAATGGTVDEVMLCRSLAIPNGTTTVNKLMGYEFDLPFGAVGTTHWGFYSKPATAHNYFAGDVVIGTSDTPTNSSVGLELNSTTKAILNSRMTSTQRDSLTAVNGMVLYNTTTDKLQVYAAGSWVDLH